MHIKLDDEKTGGGFVKSARRAISDLRASGRIQEGETLPHEDHLVSEAITSEEAHLVIAHKWNSSWNELLENSRSGSVRIRVSSGGLEEGPPPDKRQNGPYVFHLRRHSDNVTVDEWKEIIAGVSDPEVCDALVQGENPQGLRKYFARTSVEILSALSILCQGYLAVHAERYNEDEETWDPREISPALEQMDWSEDLMSNGPSNRTGDVTDPGWWQVFDGEDTVIEEAEKEWGDEAEGWTKVRKLLIRVIGDTDEEDTDETEPKPLDEKRDRKLVAEAYCALAERLGGEPCPQS